MHIERFRRDVVVNLCLSILGALTTLWVIRQAGALLTPAALGLFLLGRRFADSFSNVVQIGLPLALKRYLALTTNPRAQARYLALGSGLTVVSCVLAFGGVALRPSAWSSWLFASETLGSLALATAGLTASLALTNLVISSMYAFRWYVRANIISTVNGAVWMIAYLAWQGPASSVTVVITVQAVLATLIALLSLAALWWRCRLASEGSATLPVAPPAREFVSYGLLRTLSPFFETLLFSVAAWSLRHNPAEAGQLLVAFTLLRLANLALQPVGAVASVATAQLQGEDRGHAVLRGLNLLTGCLLYIGVAVLAAGYPWIPMALTIWLRNPMLSANVTVFASFLFLGMLPYLTFQGLKQVIDMLRSTPLNLYTSVLALVVLGAVWAGLRPFVAPATATLGASTAGLYVMGLASIFWIRHDLAPLSFFGPIQLILAGALVATVNGLAAMATVELPMPLRVSIALAATSGSLLLAGLALVRIRPSPLVGEILIFIRRRSIARPAPRPQASA